MKLSSVEACRPQSFSVILPTFNRAFCLCEAIDSLLRQTFGEWELIIVDDGSTDGTEALLRKRYAVQFSSGKFVFLRQENRGVSNARNAGVSMAKGDWIAYLDSDNTVRADWLQALSDAVASRPDAQTAYGKFVMRKGREEKGAPFDWDRLLLRNYIDLGVFVHRRSIVGELGGFDESFRRLVDWELVLRYTKVHPPVFVDRVLMDYNDSREFQRITGTWNGNQDWKAAVMDKHGRHLPLVTTVIPTCGHKAYIADAIESAMRQEGPFRREIVVSDDGSDDGTAEIVAAYAERYPHLVRNLSTGTNVGISANVRRCIAAARGSFIALLEGDDYWSGEKKLATQLAFLQEHAECPMVFSRTYVLEDGARGLCVLKSQDGLPELMRGRDFFATGSSSVIVNFSCCMFRRSAFDDLPECLWEPRPSEIAFAFWLERRGPIGHLAIPMSVYRIHGGGVWSGASQTARRAQEIACRRAALMVCAPEYRKDFEGEIARINEVCGRGQLVECGNAAGSIGYLFVQLLPYFLVVAWWRRYRGIELDKPLFFYRGTVKRLGRIVKFVLPYGLVNLVRRHRRRRRRAANRREVFAT